MDESHAGFSLIDPADRIMDHDSAASMGHLHETPPRELSLSHQTPPRSLGLQSDSLYLACSFVNIPFNSSKRKNSLERNNQNQSFFVRNDNYWQPLTKFPKKEKFANFHGYAQNNLAVTKNTPCRNAPPGSIQSKPTQTKPKFFALDLFSGTGSVGERLRQLGFHVTSLDIDPKTNANIKTDIMTWDYVNQYPPGHFHVIAASVPCNEYSCAKTVGERKLRAADDLVTATLEIVDFFQPLLWWIENPSGGLLKTRDHLKKFPFVDVDYCQFSDWGYQKPTRFWGSQQIGKLEDRKCDQWTCPNLMTQFNGTKRHKYVLGGNNMKFSTKLKGRIPWKLVDYLLSSEPKFIPLLPKSVKIVVPPRQFRGVRDPNTHWAIRENPNLGKGWGKINFTPKTNQYSNKEWSQQPIQEKCCKWVKKEQRPSEGEQNWVCIPNRMLKPTCGYQTNQIRKVGKKNQLLMLVPVILPDETVRKLKILVDTGAEANIVKFGLLPDNLFQKTNKPLYFCTANGQPLNGGKRIIKLRLCFQKIVKGQSEQEFFWSNGDFFEGDIKVDAILSYEWLLKNEVGIFPHHGALVVDYPKFGLLYGLNKNQVSTSTNSNNDNQPQWRRKRKGRKKWIQVCEYETMTSNL